MKTEPMQYTNIKVIGVGGGGNNAINRMISAGLDGVEFWSVNTDAQALHASLAENVMQIGTAATQGLGAGADPQIGEKSALESIDDVKKSIEGANMIFITAGMGGGTGTGASSVIAGVAKQAGALTVGVVTKPFRFEGPIRMRQAEAGIDKLRGEVDALIVIPNDKLLQVVQQTTSLKDAFLIADDVLLQGVQGIANMITKPGLINLDFADVRRIMTNAGSAMMGIGKSSGSHRAIEAAEAAISSPLLEESITGATGVILNIAGSESLTLHEVQAACDLIFESCDPNVHVIWGTVLDEDLKDEVVVTVIATGFKPKDNLSSVERPVFRAQPSEFSAPTATKLSGFDDESDADSTGGKAFKMPSSILQPILDDEADDFDDDELLTPHGGFAHVEPQSIPEPQREEDGLFDVPSFLRNLRRKK